MSGHSKWHNIRLKKGKVDAQRGALFTKLSREIILAARGGSPDPEANHRLRMAVEKARTNNVPQDNIKRAIARGSGQGNEKEIEEIRYEGYGPAGAAVVVDAATDNRNRTAADLRAIFSRNGGSLGESGSVAWNFEPCGLLEVDSADRDEDSLTEAALVDGVIDVRYHPDSSEIVTGPGDLGTVREALVSRGFKVTEMVLGVVPKNTVSLSPQDAREALGLLEALEDHEDVQRVYANLTFDEAKLEALT